MANADQRQTDGDRPSELNVLAQPFVWIVDRWMPDPFIFAILLTILTYVLAVTVAGYGPVESVEAWGNGLWDLLAFTTQIAMTLVTGYALANTPLVQKINASPGRRNPSPRRRVERLHRARDTCHRAHGISASGERGTAAFTLFVQQSPVEPITADGKCDSATNTIDFAMGDDLQAR